jgi:hypothetical protein
VPWSGEVSRRGSGGIIHPSSQCHTYSLHPSSPRHYCVSTSLDSQGTVLSRITAIIHCEEGREHGCGRPTKSKSCSLIPHTYSARVPCQSYQQLKQLPIRDRVFVVPASDCRKYLPPQASGLGLGVPSLICGSNTFCAATGILLLMTKEAKLGRRHSTQGLQ